jgi:hypothetical protein
MRGGGSSRTKRASEPVLWRVPEDPRWCVTRRLLRKVDLLCSGLGRIAPRGYVRSRPADVVTLPLTGDWEQMAGFNANGIAQTPDRKSKLPFD